MKYKKLILIALLCILTLALASYFMRSNKLILSFVAKIVYFDEHYYLQNYPEVAKLDISPFKHYSKIGWREGKNPNKDFDNNFYIRMYDSWDRSLKGLNPLQHYIKCKIRFKKCYINPAQLKKVKPLNNPKYYIALTSVFRNEARFLKEWIEFYRLMGVEYFYLYNNLSEDNYMEILDPYIKEGIVELNNINERPYEETWNRIQTAIYTDAAKKASNLAEWLVVVDSDEFLYPVKDKNLIDVLKQYDEYATLSVSYVDFGSSDVKHIPSDKLMIESLLYSEAKKDGIQTSPIVKPRYVEYFNLPNFATLKPGYAQITENYEYIYGPRSEQSINIIAGNHYWARDWDFFESTKIKRVHMSAYLDFYSRAEEEKKRSEIERLVKINNKFSKVYNDSILRFVPELRKRVFVGQNSN